MDVARSFERRGIDRSNLFGAKTREQRLGKPIPTRQVRPGFALGNEQPVFTKDAPHLFRRKPEKLLSAEGHRPLEPHTLALRPHKELEPVSIDTHRPQATRGVLCGRPPRLGSRPSSCPLRTLGARWCFDHLAESRT